MGFVIDVPGTKGCGADEPGVIAQNRPTDRQPLSGLGERVRMDMFTDGLQPLTTPPKIDVGNPTSDDNSLGVADIDRTEDSECQLECGLVEDGDSRRGHPGQTLRFG